MINELALHMATFRYCGCRILHFTNI